MSIKFKVRGGEPYVTHRTSWPESTGESSGHLVSIALQQEANAILVGTKQDGMLLYNALVKGAIKQKSVAHPEDPQQHLSPLRQLH